MSRQQLPPQIKKLEVTDRKAGKTVVRYQVTVDAGANPATGKRQQVRRRYATEKEARDALSEIGQAAATDEFVPRKAVTVEQLAADWLASLHNTRPTKVNGYTYLLAPLREQHGNLAVQKLTRPDLDKLLIALRDGGTLTGKGRALAGVVGAVAEQIRRLLAGTAGLRDRTPRIAPQRRRRDAQGSAYPQ
jgi:integrase